MHDHINHHKFQRVLKVFNVWSREPLHVMHDLGARYGLTNMQDEDVL